MKRPLSNLLLVQFCVLLVTAISACVTATPEELAAKKDLTASERGALLNSDCYLSQGIKIVEHPDMVEGMWAVESFRWETPAPVFQVRKMGANQMVVYRGVTDAVVLMEIVSPGVYRFTAYKDRE